MMQWVDEQNIYGRRLACLGIDIDEAMELKYFEFFNSKYDINHPALDIERFIDDGLRQYHIEFEPEADLPFNVLGATKFNPDGSRLIQINAKLYRERNSTISRGRFRFTCAHEVFHALYHCQLFKNRGQLESYGYNIREDVVEPDRTSNNFIEWQANRGAAALLMPVSIFKEKVKQMRSQSCDHNSLLGHLSTSFDISKQSVKVRLKTLGLLLPSGDEYTLQYNGIDSYRDHRQRGWN
jgi:Zn-dependent peptidase ImmA (M78 family)